MRVGLDARQLSTHPQQRAHRAVVQEPADVARAAGVALRRGHRPPSRCSTASSTWPWARNQSAARPSSSDAASGAESRPARGAARRGTAGGSGTTAPSRGATNRSARSSSSRRAEQPVVPGRRRRAARRAAREPSSAPAGPAGRRPDRSAPRWRSSPAGAVHRRGSGRGRRGSAAPRNASAANCSPAGQPSVRSASHPGSVPGDLGHGGHERHALVGRAPQVLDAELGERPREPASEPAAGGGSARAAITKCSAGGR